MNETREFKTEDQAMANDAAKAETKKPSVDDVATRLRAGSLDLEKPILSRDVEVSKVRYDFDKVTGLEYLDAMDADAGGTNAFRISQKQAFALFAKAAAKMTDGLDETDIRTRMGVGDVMNAVRVATLFFVSTSRAGNKRINNTP